MPRKKIIPPPVETEPVYEFVRGKGWLVSNFAEDEIVTFRDGSIYRIECRFPNIGERYMYANKHLYGGNVWFYQKTKLPKYKYWKNYCKVRNIDSFPDMRANDHAYYTEYNRANGYHWATLVKV